MTIVKIGSITEKISSCNPAAVFAGSSFIYVDINSVDRESKTILTPQTVLAEEAPSRARQVIKAGDVIVSTVRPNLNAVAWVPETLDGAICSTGFCVLRPNAKTLHDRYLFHWVKTPKFVLEMTRLATGASYPAVSDKIIKESLIPLPPLPEQKRIAAILDKADIIRRKREKAIELTDSFLRSVFLEMFGDPLKNPYGFETIKIENICDLVRGSSPRPKGDSRYYGGAIPRLMVEDLSRDGRYVYPRIDSLTVEGAKKSRPVKAGTIVMVVSGDVGRNAILQVDACIHDGFVAFNNLSQRISPEYFSFFLQAIKQTHDKRKAGAIWQNLTTSQIKDINVQLPPIALQSRFSKIVHSTQHLEVKIRNSSEKIAFLLESIQARVFMRQETDSSTEVQEVAYAL